MLWTLEENRAAIARLFADKRVMLGDKKWNTLIDELSAVRYETIKKIDVLPKSPIGVLDLNAIERTRLNKNEDMKWLLIKQKYGV
ncbi:hypothetical protein [Cohnella terricola]|uniref:Uncharacterized protein n=1 Tax=Cohnella terricola TaxID=1289167 RepID=A0A559JQD8_9BACL|nr:hypothetical protein [Cohnella terricola]TVY02078.1 hypothetical protein FPZ45_06445 [Cohnella terricola]